MSKIGKIVFGAQEKWRKFKEEKMSTPTEAPAGSLYKFEAKANDGSMHSLADYKGKVLLIVNVASRCGFTPQYAGMEATYRKFRSRGFELLAFPCNEFGGQEPGTDAEIKTFCQRFEASFPLFSKVAVKKGPVQHPLYKFLTEDSGKPGAIPWNFAKFLVSRDGRVVERFGPDTEPDADALTAKIEKLL